MRIDYLTLFPEMFTYLDTSILKRAQAAGVFSYGVHDMRDQATNKHRTVDDTPAGGGAGMVLRADILGKAIDSLADDNRPRLLMSPRGKLVREKIHSAFGFRFIAVDDYRTAIQFESIIKSGRLAAGRPRLNPSR